MLALIALLFGAIATGWGAIIDPGARPGATGKYGLELDGVFVGWMWSADGGQPCADVITEKLGPDHVQKKHLGPVKYEDITLQFGTGCDKVLYEWMKATLASQYTRKNGAVINADYTFHELSRLEFTNALINLHHVPSLNADSKDACYITLTLAPESTHNVTPGLTKPDLTKYATDYERRKGNGCPQTSASPSTGWKKTTAFANKIDALPLTIKVVENPLGELRDYQKQPANLETPD